MAFRCSASMAIQRGVRRSAIIASATLSHCLGRPVSAVSPRAGAPRDVTPRTAATATPTRAIVALSFAACGSAAALRVCDPLLPRLTTEFGIGLGVAAQVGDGVRDRLRRAAARVRPDRRPLRQVPRDHARVRGIGAHLAAVRALARLRRARRSRGSSPAPPPAALIPLSLAWIGDVVPYERRQPVLARFLLGQMFGISLGPARRRPRRRPLGREPVFWILAAWFAASAGAAVALAAARGVAAGHAGVVERGLDRRRASARCCGCAGRASCSRPCSSKACCCSARSRSSRPICTSRVRACRSPSPARCVMLYGVGRHGVRRALALLVRRLGEPGLAAAGGMVLFVCLARIAVARTRPGSRRRRVLSRRPRLLHAAQHAAGERDADGAGARGSSVALFAASLFIGQSTGVALGGFAAERSARKSCCSSRASAVLVLALAFAAAARRLARRPPSRWDNRGVHSAARHALHTPPASDPPIAARRARRERPRVRVPRGPAHRRRRRPTHPAVPDLAGVRVLAGPRGVCTTSASSTGAAASPWRCAADASCRRAGRLRGPALAVLPAARCAAGARGARASRSSNGTARIATAAAAARRPRQATASARKECPACGSSRIRACRRR